MGNQFYKTKNRVQWIWVLPFLWLSVIYFFVGIELEEIFEVVFLSLVIVIVNSYVVWKANKDKGLVIENNEVRIQNKKNDVKVYSANEISSYEILYENGVKVVLIHGRDYSFFLLASYFLNLDGLKEALNSLLKTSQLESQ